MTIDVDPDWWKTLFDEVYLLTDARSVDNRSLPANAIELSSVRNRSSNSKIVPG